MTVTVFCGSAGGNNPVYTQLSKEFGNLLAHKGYKLVYGGGHVGIMGTVADGVLEKGGYVIGVIPEALEEKELAHMGLQELHVVEDMHTRKAMMADKCDAFIAMPGGIGTLEEIFEGMDLGTTWIS